jgi:2-oxoglutarate dehydrogenase complex dehydrogenase (E1) component-like enzyme
MTPKSLLRQHAVVSSWQDLESGQFERVIAPSSLGSQSVGRVVLSMGKLYYELAAARDERQRTDIAILRIEQFYPFPTAELTEALAGVPVETPIVWCQEEPANMGAWRYLQSIWSQVAPGRPPLVGITRPESASPATGSHSAHRQEQAQLIDRALAP